MVAAVVPATVVPAATGVVVPATVVPVVAAAVVPATVVTGGVVPAAVEVAV